MHANDTVLEMADESHLAALLPLVRAYHEFEQVAMSDNERARAVKPLLREGTELGRIWLVRHQGAVVGYAALCFGYSIEFRGRDAFVDELFIVEQAGRIGEAFYRGDPSRTRDTGGTGLGLYLATLVAKAHDGTLELTNPGEPGACFEARIPL